MNGGFKDVYDKRKKIRVSMVSGGIEKWVRLWG